MSPEEIRELIHKYEHDHIVYSLLEVHKHTPHSDYIKHVNSLIAYRIASLERPKEKWRVVHDGTSFSLVSPLETISMGEGPKVEHIPFEHLREMVRVEAPRLLPILAEIVQPDIDADSIAKEIGVDLFDLPLSPEGGEMLTNFIIGIIVTRATRDIYPYGRGGIEMRERRWPNDIDISTL